LAAPRDIPDLLDVEVPVGGRVIVLADLHLATDPTPVKLAADADLAVALEAATGPGALIIAGNLFDSGADPRAALAAHSRLTGAVSAYGQGPGRRVVILPGDRDSRLAWSEPCQAAVTAALAAEIALAADLHIDTGTGLRKIHVEPGHNLDPISRFEDPRNPRESPFGQHVRDELLPSVRKRQAGAGGGSPGWLAGVEDLDEPAALSRFIGSRLVYRRFIRSGWILLVPVVFALILRIPTTLIRSARAGALTTRVGLFVLAAFIELLFVVALSIFAFRRTNRALAAISLDEEGTDRNELARSAGRDLVTSGYAGLITAHTCRAELTRLGTGFYANAGAGAELVTEFPSRVPGLGLPPVFLAQRVLSWVEMEAGNELHVRLFHGSQSLPGATLVERLVAKRTGPAPTGELRADVVASFPHGEIWPQPESTERRDRRVRRVAATVVVAFGFISLVSAMSDPLRDRLDVLRELFPLYVAQTAAALAAFVGVALIVLARGIRRGQRRAWVVCEILLLAVAVLHLIKGVDVEETVVALAVAGAGWIYRDAFRAKTDVEALGRGLIVVLSATLLTIIAGTVGIELSTEINQTRHHAQHRISWIHALQASVERMVGNTDQTLPHHIDQFVTPAMATATVGLVLALLAVLFRPVVARRRSGRDGTTAPAGSASSTNRVGAAAGPASTTSAGAQPGNHAAPAAGGGDLARARAVMEKYGSGTLDYFALRPDKDFFFWGETVVAYAVYGGVCLVSPDPIGPPAEREEAWRAFRRHVDSHGWALGGLGIGEEWLPIYRSTGMHDLYAGDEGVVRVNRFTLEGGKFKGLRQAVNRIAKYGYRISFHDPSDLDPELRESLKDVMTKSRRGDVERGFSMTLGRAFDPADAGLLLAVVHGPAPQDAPEGTLGEPVAFCQYVPAPGIGGFSLDLMRRDDGEHPNGLMDFAVVETIRELKARGGQGLGLNFATMRAVLAGEAGEGLTQKVQAWALRRMGDSMQIESLWKFNAKFDPDWQPRYAIYDAPENLLAVAIAVARAESFWELPLIGRFLVPNAPETASEVAQA
jgi:lysylphosphatidylglycerol synthetase-like protein (DUF2156 family)